MEKVAISALVLPHTKLLHVQYQMYIHKVSLTHSVTVEESY